MKFLTLDDYKDLSGKRVLVRLDLNSPIINGKVQDNERIKEHSKTVNELIKKRAKVVLISHQGRKGNKDFISLKQHSKLLNKYVKIKFVPSIIKDKALNEIKNLKNGEALLLENIRFLKEEFTPPDNKIVKTLSPLFDYYVNDAFSVSHREQTSIVGFPKILRSCIGRVMEKELKNLDKIKINNCLFILGGAKAEENILLLKNKNVLTFVSLVVNNPQGLGRIVRDSNGKIQGIVEEKAKEAVEKAKKAMSEKKEILPGVEAEAALRRALLELKIAQRKKKILKS